MTTPADDRSSDQSGVKLLLDFGEKVLAPAGVLTGVLYYFGYQRERALFGHFGVDLGTVGFSSTDYLLRSTETVFVPLIVLLLATVAAVLVHHALAYVMTLLRPRRQRVVWLVLVALALGLLVAAGIGVRQRADPTVGSILGPVALGAGAVLLQYGLDTATPGRLPAGVVSALTGTRTVRRAATTALVLVAIFWSTANLAHDQGVAAARSIELSLPLSPQAVVYSSQRLQISGPGVGLTTLDGTDARYRYRYNGLRTLLHNAGLWFLLPVGWTADNGATVILLPEDTPGIRVDVAP